MDRELVQDSLEKEHGGFQITVASSQEEFEAQLQRGEYDIVLTDFNILGFEGLQVLDTVRSSRPSTPVVIVTGTGSEEIAVEALKRGAADYVIKSPHHIRRLPRTMQAALEKHRLIEEHRLWEMKLQKSEERFRAIFDRTPQGLFLADDEGRFVSVNRVWQDMFGYSAEEARRCTYRDVTFHDEIDESLDLFDSLFKGQRISYRHERRYITKDGTIFWGDVAVQLFDDSGSGQQRALGVVTDITERKRAEDLILSSESKHRALLEGAPVGIILIDQRGSISEVNQALLELMGSPSAEATKAINAFSFMPMVESGISHACKQCMEEYTQLTFETPYTSKWGKQTHLRIHLSPVQDPVDGSIMCLGALEDISDVKEAEAALLESESMKRGILEGISTNVAFVNKNLEIVWANRAACESAGRTPDDMVGQTCHSLWAEADKPCTGCPTVKALESGKTEWAEISTPDGNVWDERGEPIFDSEGKLLGVVEIAHDITDRKRAEQELGRSEARFRELFEKAPVMMHSIDRDATIRNVNEKWLTTMGYARHQVLGKKITSFMEPKSQEVFHRVMEDFWQDLEVHDINYQYVTRDGSVIDTLLDAIAIDDETWGKVSITTLRNITQLKAAESALEESRSSFINVVEGSVDGILVTDPEGVIQYGNPAASRIFALEQDRLHGTRVQLPKTDGVPLECEVTRSHSEENRIVEMRASETIWEGLPCYIVLIRDVTDLREAQKGHRRLVTAIEQAAESVMITDEEGMIVYVNPAFEKISGYMKSEVIGRNPRFLKSGEHDDDFYTKMWNSISQGKVWSGHLINRRKDGSRFEEDATISPIRDDAGRITSYVAVKRDVTAEFFLRKQLQKAQKLESIATLAGGIAHDFNNLLTIVSGYAELLLLERSETSAGFNELQAISHDAKRGTEQVKRILTFSRQVETFPTRISLNEEARQVKKLLARTIPKMVKIELILADDLKPVNADAGQIEQSLMNLAVNAHQAMPDGGKLTIETRNITLDEEYCETHVEARPGEYVLLEVSDTGQGMKKEVVDRIFEPFFSTKRVGEGTGLGLAMVYGIVKGHGGFITCYSTPGVGTTFRIYLPAAVRIEEQSEVAVEEPKPTFGTETVLLVDDEESIRQLGTRILKQAGYTVHTAENGKQALEVYERLRDEIALVVMDMIMPEMGGKECLEHLVARDPDVKVVIASGFSVEGVTKETVKGRARAFVTKPFRMKQLQEAVRQVLDEE